MKKVLVGAALAVAFSAPLVLPASAADLENNQGQSCPEGSVGTWHFVNNQTGGVTTPGTLTAIFDGGAAVAVVGPSAINKNTQHFLVDDFGTTLTSASTDLPGRLVLSDFSCGDVKKPPPKK